MRTLLLALACLPAYALPPVTQEEAIAFHNLGRCVLVERGQGLTRRTGWVTSPLPGPHEFRATHGVIGIGRGNRWTYGEKMTVDIEPGQVYGIRVSIPGATLEWKPMFRPSGRDEWGAVPPAMLWDAKLVGDQQ